MDDTDQPELPDRTEYLGVYRHGVIQLTGAVDWADETPVTVRVADFKPGVRGEDFGKVIIAGFGMAGRWIADIFDRHDIDYVIVEQNADTIQTQRKLGRDIIEGDIAEEATLRRAGIEQASILALTIPDEEAVLRATRVARALKPGIYIVARTNYSSAGMLVSQCGADDVITAELVVARQFFEMLLRRINRPRANDAAPPARSEADVMQK